jgi:hypothetical protein
MKDILDQETYRRTKEALAHALHAGLDPVEALHQAHLILTAERFEEIQVQALQGLLLSFYQWRPDELLRFQNARDSHTPFDMHARITEWLEAYVKERS